MKVNRRIFGVAIVGVLGFLAGQSALAITAAGPELLTNPGFETGDFSGWTLSGSLSFEAVSPTFATTPNSGNYSAYFGAVGSYNYLSQWVATRPGDSYEISFYLANSGGNNSDAFLDWGGTQEVDVNTPNAFGWTYYSVTETASAWNTKVLFGFQQDPAYFNLDDTSVRDLTPHSDIPDQPVGLWMTAATLLGLCAAGYRRCQEVA